MSVARAVTSGGRRIRWYYWIIPGLLFLLPVALWHLSEQPQAVRLVGTEWVPDPGEYVGAEACRECHAALVEKQLGTRHARTVRDLSREAPAAPFGTGQAVVDPLTGARYSMEKVGGHPAITVTSGDQRVSQRLDFEFGSGAHARGYIGRIDDTAWIDARLNFYTKLGAWDFTSGQEKPQAYLQTQPLGRPEPPERMVRCFWCHSSVVRATGLGKSPPDGSGLRVRPDHSSLGVTCESCHGAQGEHVRERQAREPVQPKERLSADAINQMCGRCHGLSSIDPAHPVITRFQPWGLERSPCFRGSAGRLSCVTCHDPHEDARKDTVFYEKKCLSCHTGSPGAVARTHCPVNRKSGCVKCHMPEDSTSMLHMALTDHRIRVVRDGSKLQAALRARMANTEPQGSHAN